MEYREEREGYQRERGSEGERRVKGVGSSRGKEGEKETERGKRGMRGEEREDRGSSGSCVPFYMEIEASITGRMESSNVLLSRPE